LLLKGERKQLEEAGSSEPQNTTFEALRFSVFWFAKKSVRLRWSATSGSRETGKDIVVFYSDAGFSYTNYIRQLSSIGIITAIP
jgi:hypothetical protein